MAERLFIAATFALAGIALYHWYIRQQLARISAANPISDPVLKSLVPGVPAIVYFTTPTCIPCIAQQQPALKRLKAELGDSVQIVQIDATRQPEDADRWGVLSAPTTFVLNSRGQPDAVNHGVADEHKLKKQVYAAMKIA